MIRCDGRLEVLALPGVPLIGRGDDVAALARAALERAGCRLGDGDVLVVTSKVIASAQGRFVDLSGVAASPDAVALAAETVKDPRFCELVLRESTYISRRAPNVLIVRHRLGFLCANAGIDCSNAVPRDAAPGSGPWALLL